jgi:hypothetical protein
MRALKIKISDEPRILATAVRHPYQVVLNFEGITETLTGLIEGDSFVFVSKEDQPFKDAIILLTDNKINYSVEF